MYGMGNLFQKAGKALREEIVAVVAARFGVSADALDIRDAVVFVKGDNSKKISVREISDASIYNRQGPCRSITIEESFTPAQNPFPKGAVFADLEVDIETGMIQIKKVLIVHDCGRAINPMTVEGQLEGGVTCGLGYALYEDLSINPNTGAVEGNNFSRYKLPSTLDMPNLDVNLFEEPCQSGPFGAKAVGMSGTIGVPAAIANAIYDAVGIRLNAMPFTPERVLSALKEKI
jgi:xanthine dehydrogenase molybdenum-binding subunit